MFVGYAERSRFSKIKSKRWWVSFLLLCLALEGSCLMNEACAKNSSYGLVKVALANVMSVPDWDGERVTQARFGEQLQIIGQKGSWYKVLVSDQERDDRGYLGWTLKINLAVGEHIPPEKCMRVKTLRGHLLAEPKADSQQIMTVYANCYLQEVTQQGDWYAVKMPGQKRQVWINKSEVLADLLPPSGESLIAEAKRFLGTPYLWGGMSALGIDCSGLTYTVYERHGLLLPRDADEQYQCGEPVETTELRGGDLLFFGRPGRVTHVGMYISNGLFIHASSRRGVSVMSLQESERYRYYLGARRILE